MKMLSAVQSADADETVAGAFVRSLSLLEQAHRRLHDVVKDALERNGERHLTGVQALLIYEIGEGETPSSQLRSRGAFAGTSLSYTLKKLSEGGYLEQYCSDDDRRTKRLTLTKRGLKVRQLVEDLFERQATALEPTASVRPDDLETMNRTVSRLERFWTDQIRYQL